eukprot:TRINITY_DN38517_c0_g1_i1.p1 TRINITY_DN38517_c0_g1~~TRINITY_DN38517_c0_g1_i1.p1  ORF type:complete len:1289 (-),score=211.90 TRINITY_DN38517_c0_g1_i1:57-3923(-)
MGTCVTTEGGRVAADAAMLSSNAHNIDERHLSSENDICVPTIVKPPRLTIDELVQENKKQFWTGLHGYMTSQVPGCSHIGKKFCAFLSYHEKDCAKEAWFLKAHLEDVSGFGSEVFLDSEELQDTRQLLGHIRDSDCIVLLLSTNVLARPWCILELCAAIEEAVPIVAVTVLGQCSEYTEGMRFLTFLDNELEHRNPGATNVLRSHGLTPLDAAYLLSSVIPNISRMEMDLSASKSVLRRSLADITDMVRNASPVLISTSKLEWLESRDMSMSARGAKQHVRLVEVNPADGSSRVENDLSCAPVPSDVPTLPKAYARRAVLESSVKEALFAPPSVSVATSSALQLLVHGPSGCGKTIFAAAIARDQDVRQHFGKVCFISVHEKSRLLDLQMTLWRKLSDQPMDLATIDEANMDRALSTAAASSGVSTLVVVDGATSAEQLQSLCGWMTHAGSDSGPPASCVVMATARVPFGSTDLLEMPLCAMEPDEAVALMWEACDGRICTPPFSAAEHGAVAECDWLPLNIVIAGGFLAQYLATTQSSSNAVDAGAMDEFTALLRGSGEYLEGDNGRGRPVCRPVIWSGVRPHVNVTPSLFRVLRATLEFLESNKCEAMVRFFYRLAIHPESVILPTEIFDMFATFFAEEEGHSEAQTRSWLTSLLRLGFIQGSLAEGIWQHRAVREFTRQHLGSTRATQRRFVEVLLSARPAVGWPPFVRGTVAGDSHCYTVEHYVARHGWWHIHEAFNDVVASVVDGKCDVVEDELLEQLVASDIVLAEACADALGNTTLVVCADAAERAGKALIAAHYLRACSLPVERGCEALSKSQDMLLRAQKLLQHSPGPKSREAEQFELELLGRLVVVLPEGPGNSAARARRHEIVRQRHDRGDETAQDALLDSLTYCEDAGAVIGCFVGRMCAKKIDSGQLSRAVDLWINSARRCVDAANLSKEDASVVSVARCVGLHHLATMWGIGARGFIESGVLDELGGAAGLVDVLRCYDHNRDNQRFYEFQKLNIVIDGLHVLPLLTLGRVADANECISKLCAIWETHFHEISSSAARHFHAHELWLCCQSALPALVRLNMPQARLLAGSLRLLEWNSSTCRLIWEQAVRPWSGALGGEPNSFTLLQTFLNLQAFVIDPEITTKDHVRTILEARETLLEMSDTSWDVLVLEWAMLETAALAAEKLEDDALAEWFSNRGIERYDGLKQGVVASLLMLKVRILERRGGGNEEEVETLRLRAGSLAIEAGQPLQVFNLMSTSSAVEEMIDRACGFMKRQRDELMLELSSAVSKTIL